MTSPEERTGGRRARLAATMIGSVAIASGIAAIAGGDPERQPDQASGRTALSAVESFAFAIGDRTTRGDLSERYARYDLVVLDGEDAPARKVADLRREGKVVLAYLSVGTIERWRSWFRAAISYRLAVWRDWSGEWFADASDPGYRELIADRVAPRILDKGFDGLFLDNTDMISSRGAQAPGMHALVARLADLVHADGGYLFAQNGDRTVRPMLDDLDGWNREDVTRTWDFDRRRYARVPSREHRAALAVREVDPGRRAARHHHRLHACGARSGRARLRAARGPCRS